jgi:hypothetical protein
MKTSGQKKLIKEEAAMLILSIISIIKIRNVIYLATHQIKLEVRAQFSAVQSMTI